MMEITTYVLKDALQYLKTTWATVRLFAPTT